MRQHPEDTHSRSARIWSYFNVASSCRTHAIIIVGTAMAALSMPPCRRFRLAKSGIRSDGTLRSRSTRTWATPSRSPPLTFNATWTRECVGVSSFVIRPRNWLSDRHLTFSDHFGCSRGNVDIKTFLTFTHPLLDNNLSDGLASDDDHPDGTHVTPYWTNITEGDVALTPDPNQLCKFSPRGTNAHGRRP